MRLAPVLLAVSAGCLGSAALAAADREFKDIVQIISTEFQTKPMKIPLFGLVNTITFVARPAGTKHIDLAVFENLGERSDDSRELSGMIRNAVGGEWKPFVESISNRDGRQETVVIYMRPAGKHWKLLVTTIEDHEATVVQLTLNPSGLERWVSEPLRSARSWRGGQDKEDRPDKPGKWEP